MRVDKDSYTITVVKRNIMNKRTLRVLEYYKIIEQLTSYATTPAGKRMCERFKAFDGYYGDR